MGAWYRFQGLRFFKRPIRSRVRFTVLSEVRIPWSCRMRCITSELRLARKRVLYICHINSSLICLGWDFGLDDLVGIGCRPIFLASLHHLETVPGDTPYRLAAVRTPLRRAKAAQSLRTLGWFLWLTYTMDSSVLRTASVSKVLNHYVHIDKTRYLWYYSNRIPAELPYGSLTKSEVNETATR